MAFSEQKIKRLFVAEYEHADTWTRKKRSILSHVDSPDLYLIFKTGKNTLPSIEAQEIIEKMGDTKIMYPQSENLPEEDYYKYVRQQIIEHSDKDTFIYFLDMDTAFFCLQNEFNYAANVLSKPTWCVGKRPPRRSSNKMAIGKKKLAEKHSATNADGLFETVSEFVSPDINIPETKQADNDMVEEASNYIKEQQNKKKEKTEEKEPKRKESQQEIHKEEKKERAIDKLDKSFAEKKEEKEEKPVQEKKEKQTVLQEKTQEKQFSSVKSEEKTVKTEDTPKPSKPNRPKPVQNISRQRPHVQGTPSPKQPSGVQGNIPNRGMQGKTGNAAGKGTVQQTPEISQQELEDLIFGTEQVQKNFSRVYTKMDNSKAELSDDMIDRFVKELDKLSKNVRSYEFNRADYVLVMVSLVKSESYDDFVASWDITKPGCPLGIDERIYNQLLALAKYCTELFNKLYKEDKFKQLDDQPN